VNIKHRVLLFQRLSLGVASAIGPVAADDDDVVVVVIVLALLLYFAQSL
jgi:hypothetical protein